MLSSWTVFVVCRSMCIFLRCWYCSWMAKWHWICASLWSLVIPLAYVHFCIWRTSLLPRFFFLIPDLPSKFQCHKMCDWSFAHLYINDKITALWYLFINWHFCIKLPLYFFLGGLNFVQNTPGIVSKRTNVATALSTFSCARNVHSSLSYSLFALSLKSQISQALNVFSLLKKIYVIEWVGFCNGPCVYINRYCVLYRYLKWSQ